MSILWWYPLQYQQTREGEGDPHPPQRYLGFTKDQLPQESLYGEEGRVEDKRAELRQEAKMIATSYFWI